VGLAHPTFFSASFQSIPLFILQFAAVLLLGTILWHWKRTPATGASLLALLSALSAACALMSAQRSTPPQNDISQLVRRQVVRSQSEQTPGLVSCLCQKQVQGEHQ
jgi:hypothetical protein